MFVYNLYVFPKKSNKDKNQKCSCSVNKNIVPSTTNIFGTEFAIAQVLYSSKVCIM